MTLAQLADLVCRKIGKTDSESVAACKDFLRQRHEMIYDSALWAESKDYVAFPFPTTADGYKEEIKPVNPEYAGRVIFPSSVGRVLALRCGNDLLSPDQAVGLFGRDPEAFEALGTPVSFVEEGSSGLSWTLPNDEENRGDKLQFHTLNDGDAGKRVTIRGRRVILKDSQVVPSKVVTEETVTLTASVALATELYVWVESLSKDPTLGVVLVSSQLLWNEGFDEWEPESNERRHVVCRIVQRPAYDPARPLMLYACVKKKIQPLVSEGDVPVVRGIDNALLAFAQADMLERGRQYSKAQLKTQEAVALLQAAMDLQVGQGASLAQIQPAGGPIAGDREDFSW
ncbi:MAG TPA: hypothetical protein VMF06_06900 [Candidatus Limnocylindria bacterium]|jgi:hypothetical protein|nr:hypothetical protein [Candidatus Limnocylindria bacterium]